MADGNHSEEPTRPVQHSPEFAFTVEQLTGHERKISDLMVTLIVGGVSVSDVLIDSGATCNVVPRQQTWEMLKLKGINTSQPESFLLTVVGNLYRFLGFFSADVSLTGNNTGCRADFVVVKGDG